MRSYEMIFIARPEVEGDDLTTVVGEVEELIERNNGRVTHIEPWGLRRLAYPIQDQEEGQYVALQLDLEPQGVAAVDRRLKLMGPIMRHLILRVD